MPGLGVLGGKGPCFVKLPLPPLIQTHCAHTHTHTNCCKISAHTRTASFGNFCLVFPGVSGADKLGGVAPKPSRPRNPSLLPKVPERSTVATDYSLPKEVALVHQAGQKSPSGACPLLRVPTLGWFSRKPKGNQKENILCVFVPYFKISPSGHG